MPVGQCPIQGRCACPSDDDSLAAGDPVDTRCAAADSLAAAGTVDSRCALERTALPPSRMSTRTGAGWFEATVYFRKTNKDHSFDISVTVYRKSAGDLPLL